MEPKTKFKLNIKGDLTHKNLLRYINDQLLSTDNEDSDILDLQLLFGEDRVKMIEFLLKNESFKNNHKDLFLGNSN